MPGLKDLLYPDAGLKGQIAPAISFRDAGPSYAISPALAELLTRLVEQDHHNVLEFGAGTSSAVFAQALPPDGHLTSLEQWPEWCAESWAKVEATGIDAVLMPVTPRLVWWPFPCHRYQTSIENRGPYDLVLVDAPQWFYGRDGALPLIYRHLTPNALIVVDDAGRSQEQWAIKRWLATYPGLTLDTFDPTFGRNGVAILRAIGLVEQPNVRSWISGLLHVGVNAVVRVKRGVGSSLRSDEVCSREDYSLTVSAPRILNSVRAARRAGLGESFNA